MPSKFLGYQEPKSYPKKVNPIKIKAVKVGNSLRMTIPQDMCVFLDINAGNTLLVSLNGNILQVKKG